MVLTTGKAHDLSYEVVESFGAPEAPKSAALTLLGDQHITFPNWGGVILRLVIYRLSGKKVYRVLADRFNLSGLSVAQCENYSITSAAP